MSEITSINSLTAALAEPTLAEDLHKVRAINQQVVRLLTSLPQGQARTPEMSLALQHLKVAYCKVYDACQGQSDRLEGKMAQHRQHSEALSAYESIAPDEGDSR